MDILNYDFFKFITFIKVTNNDLDICRYLVDIFFLLIVYLFIFFKHSLFYPPPSKQN